MPQAAIRLTSPASREKAATWCWNADAGTLITFSTPDKRTLTQNATMWLWLTAIAERVEWHGQTLTPDDWKLLFLADMGRGMRMVPALDGRGFVNLNVSSSALRVGEFAELLDAILKFAGDHGVEPHTSSPSATTRSGPR
jgi:hypothetical protein